MKHRSFLMFFCAGLIICAISAKAQARCYPSYYSEVVTNEVNRILEYAGVGNIVARATNFHEIKTAAAGFCRGERIVYVNERWLARNNVNSLEKRAILAHEVGHHLAGHTLNKFCSYREELQADYYAGFILYKMGVGKSKATSVTRGLPDYYGDCHPGREERLHAMEVGWWTAEEQANPSLEKYYLRMSNCMTSDYLPGKDSFKNHHDRDQQLIAIVYGPPDPTVSVSPSRYRWCLVFHPESEGFIDEKVWKGDKNYIKRVLYKHKKEGYRIDRLRYSGNGRYVMIMEKTDESHEFRQKHWDDLGDSFPSQKISKGWKDGFRITDISYRDGNWILVMTQKEDNYITQSYLPSSHYPSEKEIRDYWDKGYLITNVVYGSKEGNMKWFFVMTKFQEPKRSQKVFQKAFFPDLEINYHTGNDYHVTAIEYQHGKWTVVMTDCGLTTSLRAAKCARGFNGMR